MQQQVKYSLYMRFFKIRVLFNYYNGMAALYGRAKYFELASIVEESPQRNKVERGLGTESETKVYAISTISLHINILFFFI